jgi:HK97 family phage major capsid protein
MKIWVVFVQAFSQKSKDKDGKDTIVSFKDKDVIQLDEATATKLIELGICRKAEEKEIPLGNANLDTIVKGIEETITKSVENLLVTATKNAGENIRKHPNFAVAKDTEKEGLRGFESSAHFFGAVVKAVGVDNAITKQFDIGQKHVDLLTKAPSGQNISTDAEGNWLVPDSIAQNIWSNMEAAPGSILPQTVQFTTSGNNQKIPRIFESSRKAGDGKRFGGIQTYWLDEADEFTSTKFKTGKMQMDLHKLGALVYFTEELLSDEGFNVEGFIKRWVPEAINFAVAESFITGNGVGKPLGVLNSDALITIPALTKAGAAQTNHTILHWNISELYWKNINRSKASFYAHPDLLQQLEFMYFNDDSTNQRPIYLPANQVNQGPFGTLYGRPVIPYEFMQDFGSKGDIANIDWSAYATLRKAGANGGVNFAESIHVRFLFEETAFRFSTRIDGRPLWSSTKEDLNGDTRRSPFVTLASRTGGGSSSGL